MKTFADDTNRRGAGTQHLQDDTLSDAHLFLEKSAHGDVNLPAAGKYTRLFPYATFFAMVCAVLVMDAILPLRNLGNGFHQALLTLMGPWPIAPSSALFPGWRLFPPTGRRADINLLSSWGTLALLFGAFTTVFLVYLFALRRLPALVSRRFILNSTLVLGVLFLLIPVFTSSDIYSYIAYARIGVIHGLNPLTTLPRAMHNKDVIYDYVSWLDQPSAYGPTWTMITSFFQWIFAICGLGSYLLPMVLALRFWGLAMHLSSVCLVWSIGGSLQRLHGIVSAKRRLFATLAFAWNPMLLLEACTNAHNDTTLLFIILLAIWCLVRAQIKDAPASTSLVSRVSKRLHPAIRSWLLYLAPAVLLGLGTCLKINLVMLIPGLLFYLWLQEDGQPVIQRLKRVSISLVVYAAVIVGMYVPFWQGGAVLTVLKLNPSTYRSINTLPYTFSHLYDGMLAAMGYPVAKAIGSPAELFLHSLSMGIFVLIYAALCWQVLRSPALMRSIYGLVRWMAITWLFYCSIGSPWFWPWYMITFFGLYALMESSKPAQAYIEEQFTTPGSKPASLTRLFKGVQDKLLQPGVVRLLALSMMAIYGFATWGPVHSAAPGLLGFQWSYLSGACAWLIPLFGLRLASKPKNHTATTLAHAEALPGR